MRMSDCQEIRVEPSNNLLVIAIDGDASQLTTIKNSILNNHDHYVLFVARIKRNSKQNYISNLTADVGTPL